MKQLLSFLFGQVISNLVLLSIAGVLFFTGLSQASHIPQSDYMVELFPLSTFVLLCTQFLGAFCLFGFVFLNVVRDFQIFNSVKSSESKPVGLIAIVKRELVSRTGLMLLALGGFLGVAISDRRPRIWFCRDIVAVCGIGKYWKLERTIFGTSDFQYPMTVMVATSIGLMLFSLSVAIVFTFCIS